MKLLLVLMVLACRELVTEEWRLLLTKLVRQWRDSVLRFSQTRKESALVVLAFIVSIPALLIFALLLLVSGEAFGLWTYLLAVVVLVPVFVDRRLPSVFLSYRQQWLNEDAEDVPRPSLAEARLQLMTCYLEELFTPLFWLFLFDVWGIVVVSVYYSLRLCVEQSNMADVATHAQRFVVWMNWIPSRVLALSFALAGQFVDTWTYWQANISYSQILPVEFIDAAAEKAEGAERALDPSPIALVSSLAAYDALCYRSLIIWVVLLALHMLF